MAPTTPTVLLWVFPLLVALEAALLLAWTALFFVALKKEDERLTLDITTSAAHFVVLISLIELHARLTEACRKGVCTVKPTVSWLMPALVSLFFDIFGVARAITFYADHADYQVLTTCTMASSLLTLIWSAMLYLELTGMGAK